MTMTFEGISNIATTNKRYKGIMLKQYNGFITALRSSPYIASLNLRWVEGKDEVVFLDSKLIFAFASYNYTENQNKITLTDEKGTNIACAWIDELGNIYFQQGRGVSFTNAGELTRLAAHFFGSIAEKAKQGRTPP